MAYSFCWDLAFETQACGHLHQISERPGLHLSHHLPPVGLHCDFADPEFAADLLVHEAGDDQRHDLLFAATERHIAAFQRFFSASRSSNVSLRSIAVSIAASRTSLLKGFVKKSAAPAFIAWTVIGTSP